MNGPADEAVAALEAALRAYCARTGRVVLAVSLGDANKDGVLDIAATFAARFPLTGAVSESSPPLNIPVDKAKALVSAVVTAAMPALLGAGVAAGGVVTGYLGRFTGVLR